MTMHAEFVRTGAAATRRTSKLNPMEILTNLRDKDPTESKERQFEKWRKIIEGNETLLEATLFHAFINYWSSLDRDHRAERRQPEQPEQKAQRAAEVALLVERAKNIVLLDLILPGGKKLRDATFADCAKAGSWYAKIAKRGRPNQIVGVVLSESDLQKIARA